MKITFTDKEKAMMNHLASKFDSIAEEFEDNERIEIGYCNFVEYDDLDRTAEILDKLGNMKDIETEFYGIDKGE